jgi:hypothetical protein
MSLAIASVSVSLGLDVGFDDWVSGFVSVAITATWVVKLKKVR